MFKKYLSEFIGTSFLIMIVVGSGIMGENLSSGNIALALLANSLATGFGLFVLIESFGPISGAHFNPVVTLLEFLSKKITKKELGFYFIAQFFGAYLGILLSHLMFDLSLFQISTKERLGLNLFVSEIVATIGLLSVIKLVSRHSPHKVAAAVSCYIASAYWFTSSTSFANPAVTFARMFTNTFCGIAPNGFVYFVLAQLVGLIVINLAFSITPQTLPSDKQ